MYVDYEQNTKFFFLPISLITVVCRLQAIVDFHKNNNNSFIFYFMYLEYELAGSPIVNYKLTA